MAYVVKKRCIFCHKVLREDGTCQNPNCVRYVPDKPIEETAHTESIEGAE